tara:strand:+ start:15934 stop:16644 length:711 start_codon:yes stop_codon:yes gene_type:complete
MFNIVEYPVPQDYFKSNNQSIEIAKKRHSGNQKQLTEVGREDLYWLWEIVQKIGKGKMVECGVARGGCLAICSKANPELNIIGLDSWEGMPNITNRDNRNICLPQVGTTWGTIDDVYNSFKIIGASTDKLTLIKGFVQKTIPTNLELFHDLDILRIDTDFYESVKFCLDTLYDYVKPGGLVILDDWGFNPDGVQGAVNDFFKSKNINPEIQIHKLDTLWHQGRYKGPARFWKPKII